MVQSNGDVILLRSLDYETQREYQITVIASVCYYIVYTLYSLCVYVYTIICIYVYGNR